MTNQDIRFNKTPIMLSRIAGFSMMVACFFIMTNEAVPTFRHAQIDIVAYRSLGMMAVFSLLAFLPKFTSKLLAKAYFQLTLFALLLVGVALCFVAVMLDPQFLYSGVMALIIGLLAAVAVWYWVNIFKDSTGTQLLLLMPYVLLVSVILMLIIVLLPEPYHEYAVLVSAICSVVLGGLSRRMDRTNSPEQAKRAEQLNQTSHTKTRKAATIKTLPNQTLLLLAGISASLGVTSELIKLLSFESLYETPDILYMTFCALTFLALFSAFCFVLYKSKGLYSLASIAILALAIAIMVVFASLFTWIGHRGLFVFMGNTSFF